MLKKVNEIVSKIEEGILGIGILAITFILFINVVLRYVFGYSMVWVEEFSRYGIIWVCFIGASVCVYKGAHLGVDAIDSILSKRGKRSIHLFNMIIAVLFSIILTVYSIKLVYLSIQLGQVSTTLRLPMAYTYGALAAGGTLMFFRFMEQLILLLKSEGVDES